MDQREQLLLIAYEALIDRLNGMTFNRFSNAFIGWDLVPIGNPAVGTVFVKENEIHIAILKNSRKKWFSKDLRQRLKDFLDMHGTLITKVSDGNEIGERFVSRIGFIKKGDIYELRKLAI